MVMLSKPFKPPSLKQLFASVDDSGSHIDERVAKRRRIVHSNPKEISGPRGSTVTTNGAGATLNQPKYTTSPRSPLTTLRNPPRQDVQAANSAATGEIYYTVLWRNRTTKKHKIWDGDGVLTVGGGYASLQDVSGRDMGRVLFTNPLLPGSTLSVGGKVVEVDCLTSKLDSVPRKPRSKAAKSMTLEVSAAERNSQKSRPSVHRTEQVKSQPQGRAKIRKGRQDPISEKNPDAAAPVREGRQTAFKNPVKDSTVLRQVPGRKPLPRHDPNNPGALVMRRPRTTPADGDVVDVVLDPLLGKYLRPHQREGVAFLYECVMGIRDHDGEGCILADEMGLGKTLQVIALLWTLLKQTPFSGAEPLIKKALIVCPVTLINNWRNEFRKWLGNERIGIFVADGKQTRLTDFTVGKSYSVMIIGYERLRTVAEDLKKGAGIDIVIADEGHRLKTVQNKSAQAIQCLNTARRVILSGTPIQNDLSEFFSMVNFVNDGLLGSYKQFVKRFENPIVRSRQPDVSDGDRGLGEERSAELAQETSIFILRRTADILSWYLPSKTEYVLFCEPTQTQANIYRHTIASPMFRNAVGSSECALQLITILKKLCNSPSLLTSKFLEADETANSASTASLLKTLPPRVLRTLGPQASAKIRILDTLLYTLSRRTSEKIVLVSNYTSTLDLLQTLLTSLSLPYLRLDGSTPSSKRQGLVDDFNRSSSTGVFAFLLSAKAGGLGLNLIGASRLVLFDVDWNPALEEQTMARIHREGQKKPCRIYRFVLKGGLEERVWQRQVVKRGLANSIMDGGTGGGTGGIGGSSGKKGVAQFSKEELKDLFRLDERPGLRTHDLIGCTCGGKGPMVVKPETSSTDFDPSSYSATAPYRYPGSRAPELSERDSSSDDDGGTNDEDTHSLPDIPAILHDPSHCTPSVIPPTTTTAIIKDEHKHNSQPRQSTTPMTKHEHKPQPESRGLMEYKIHLKTCSSSSSSGDPKRNAGEGSGGGGDVDIDINIDKLQDHLDDDVLMEVLRAQRQEEEERKQEHDDEGQEGRDSGGGGGGVSGGISWVFVKRSGTTAA